VSVGTEQTAANGRVPEDAAVSGIDRLIADAARARTNLEQRQSDTSRRLARVERIQQELRQLVGSNGRAL
jgi:uncharacterized membrane-anchored protein